MKLRPAEQFGKPEDSAAKSFSQIPRFGSSNQAGGAVTQDEVMLLSLDNNNIITYRLIDIATRCIADIRSSIILLL